MEWRSQIILILNKGKCSPVTYSRKLINFSYVDGGRDQCIKDLEAISVCFLFKVWYICVVKLNKMIIIYKELF